MRQKQLLKLSKDLGSDVPFFVSQAKFALGGGRGERLKPLNQINARLWHVLVVPNLKISTKKIYQNLKRLTKSPLNVNNNIIYALNTYNLKQNLNLHNSLEKVAIRDFPIISKIKKRLFALGIRNVSMSGSGPAMFGLVFSRKEAERLCKQLKKMPRLRVFTVRTF